MNTITLGGLPIYDPPEELDAKLAGYNSFTLKTGASNYGVGRFIMLYDDVLTLLASGAPAMQTLVMTSTSPVSNLTTKERQSLEKAYPSISFPVVVSGYVPITRTVASAMQAFTPAVSTRTGKAGDMVEVYVFDARALMSKTKTQGINVQTPLFNDYFASTLLSGAQFSWAQALTKLEIDGITWPTMPTWRPRNLVFDGVLNTSIIDTICAQLFMAAGFDVTKSVATPGVLTGLQVYNGGVMCANNTALMNTLYPMFLNGGPNALNPLRLPGKFRVSFKVFDVGNPGDPFANRMYTVDVTNATGQSGYTYPLHVGEYIAYMNSGAVTNTTELNAVANDMVTRTLAMMNSTMGEFEFAGLWPFATDGQVREVLWISDRQGARTVVRMTNERSFAFMDGQRKSLELQVNTSLVGIGGANVGLSQSGQRLIWGNAASSGNYVLVKHNGGGNGGAGTYAGYTYDIYAQTDVGLTTPLNDSGPLPVVCSRARILPGPVTPAADGSVASAYLDSLGNWGLFDVQEFHGNVQCVS